MSFSIGFSMAALLMHDVDVPAGAREALRAAHKAAAPEDRIDHLVTAARLLLEQLPLDCADARELVGLPPGPC